MSVKFRAQVDVSKFVAQMKARPEEIRKALAAGLYKFGEDVMTESKSVYCPVDTGTLRSSGRVSIPEDTGKEITVMLSYGGAAASYAEPVHEINKNYRNGKQWKYLETPLNAHVGELPAKLKEELDQLKTK